MQQAHDDKPVIGLLGGIGSGKSTVAAEFARLGCAVIDGDSIGHALLDRPVVKRALRRRWGGRIFCSDGAVDRSALAEIVFDDPDELAELNRILHPRIGRKIKQGIDRARNSPSTPAVVVDAAVLLEAAWDKWCTHLVFVEAPSELRAARARRARGWSRAEWRRREKMQISLDTKALECVYTIHNSSGRADLRRQIRRLLDRITHAA